MVIEIVGRRSYCPQTKQNSPILVKESVQYTYVDVGGAYSGVGGVPVVEYEGTPDSTNMVLDGFSGTLDIPRHLQVRGTFALTSSDTAGSVMIDAGTHFKHKYFSTWQLYSEPPRVIVTPKSNPQTHFWVESATERFTIYTATAVTESVEFDYIVVSPTDERAVVPVP